MHLHRNPQGIFFSHPLFSYRANRLLCYGYEKKYANHSNRHSHARNTQYTHTRCRMVNRKSFIINFCPVSKLQFVVSKCMFYQLSYSFSNIGACNNIIYHCLHKCRLNEKMKISSPRLFCILCLPTTGHIAYVVTSITSMLLTLGQFNYYQIHWIFGRKFHLSHIRTPTHTHTSGVLF